MILSTLRPLTGYYDVNCSQLQHPYTDSCLQANIDVVLTVLKQALKIYSVLYLFLRLIQGRFSLKPYLMDILRSTLFLMINGTCSTIVNCIFDKIFGVTYKFNVVFGSGLIAAALAYLVESRSRQRILTPYIVSNCVDSLLKVFVSRNHPYLDVLLFMFVSGRTCARLSTRVSTTGFNDSVFMLLTNPMNILRRNSYSTYQILSFWLKRVLPESDVLKIPILLTGGCVWGLLIGLGYNLVSLLVSRVSKLLSGSREEGTGVRRERRYNFRIPVLLAAYIGLFHLCRTILRNVTPLSDAISGLIAGSAISIYPFPFLSLYLFIKELQTISKSLMHSGYLPRIPYLNFILYVTFCAMQFHCVVFETENVLPSYVRFIYTVSGDTVPFMTRCVKGRECLYAV